MKSSSCLSASRFFMLLLLLGCGFPAGLFAADDAKIPPGPIPATPGAAAAAMDLDKLLAFIPAKAASCNDGFTVSGEELKVILRPQLEMMMKGPGGVSEKQLRSFAARLAQSMVKHHLMTIAATRAGFKPDFEKAKKQIEMYKKQLGAATFRKRVAIQGVPMEKIIEREADTFAIRQWLHETVDPKAKVSDAEIKKYYEKNRERFRVPERFRAAHILVKVPPDADEKTRRAAKEKIDRLLEEIRQGADFAAVAKKNSDCPSKSRGGNLGTFRRGRMVKPFQDALEKLEPGQISEVVQTRFGYHIIRRGKGIPAKQIPFAKIEARLRRQLVAQKKQEVLDGILEKLKAEFDAKIFLTAP